MLTPAITASSVSCPACSRSMARVQARRPLSLDTTMFFGAAGAGTAAEAAETKIKVLLVIASPVVLLLSLRENASGHPDIRAGCHLLCSGQEKEAAGTRSA